MDRGPNAERQKGKIKKKCFYFYQAMCYNARSLT
jgi:hypothetical protein